MSAQETVELRVGWARFRHGAFTCTVISDGNIALGPARDNFPGADPHEIDQLLAEHYLQSDEVRLNLNLLIVDTGTQLMMFDSGVGSSAAWGKKRFGPNSGRALDNMRAAGIDPSDIDVIAITHAHPDHSWGLVDDDGSRLFPNAKIALSQSEYDYWTDLSRVPTASSEQAADRFRGAHRNLVAYAGSLILLTEDAQIAPGIDAIFTPGHSPGHIVYKISSLGSTIICWGDLCHHEVLLLKRPHWNFIFDDNPAAATQQRLRIYDLVDQNGYMVFGYHFPFPGIGHIKNEGDGYSWLPLSLTQISPEA